jgi:hypothetical protein
MARQVARWTERLRTNGWPVEFVDEGLVKSNPQGGREGHGALAICTPGIATAFDAVFGRLGSEQRFPWDTVQLFDATDDSYRIASIGLGTELGVVTFMSDRPWVPSASRPTFGGPRNDIAANVRPHLPSDGWDGPFMWSIHHVTKTKEELANFVLSFLSTNTRSVSAWQVVPADHVAVRCVEVLGREEASGLLRALDLSSVEDRVAALDTLPSLHDEEPLLVWMRALAGRVEEGLNFEPTTLSDVRGQLVVSLQRAVRVLGEIEAGS